MKLQGNFVSPESNVCVFFSMDLLHFKNFNQNLDLKIFLLLIFYLHFRFRTTGKNKSIIELCIIKHVLEWVIA